MTVCRTLDEVAYTYELKVKLKEEAQAYLESQNVDELADGMEMVQLIEVRQRQLEERGGYEKRVKLVGFQINYQ